MSTKKRARVKVKDKPVTRAQAAAEFGKKKARQKRKQMKRRAVYIACGALACYAMIWVWWLAYSGRMQDSMQGISDGFWQSTATAGLKVNQITLLGRKHADIEKVKAALGVKQGDPILAIPLADMEARLKQIPEIKSVSIRRQLPNQMIIALDERQPAAWWQQGGTLKLIDADGMVLMREKYRQKIDLPVVVGTDAPKHVSELLTLLNSVPSLKHDVVAAVRVGERRWNVELAHQVVVMLPEERPQEAWKRFATLAEKNALLSKAIRSVDMRLEDRVFIMPIEQKDNPVTLTTARET